jgi:hypothetical protein
MQASAQNAALETSQRQNETDERISAPVETPQVGNMTVQVVHMTSAEIEK